MFASLEVGTILFFTITILEGDTKRYNLRDIMPEKRDYRPSKWAANSAMDVWYGNKSMIDVISREISDIMYKLTARPVRSVLQHPIEGLKRKSGQLENPPTETPNLISRVEIKFINSNNKTVNTIILQPLNQTINSTVSKVLIEPLLDLGIIDKK